MLIIAQIASTAATARLVAPREFGLYAAAQAAAGFAGYFAMNGLGFGLQRRARLSDKTVGTAMTLSLVSSSVVALALWLGASLWAQAWGAPGAVWVVRAIAVTLFLTSAATVPVALIRRHLRFRTAAVVETGAVVVGLAVGVAFAIVLHSALALALGQTVGAAALLIGASVIVKNELGLSFERREARELFTFATQLGGLSFFAYFTIMLPSLFVARTFGTVALGLYSRASLIAGLPADYAGKGIYKILYPIYRHVRDDLTRTRTLLDEALTLTTGFAWPLFALMAGASPVIVSVLLGPDWDGTASQLTFFAIAACASIPCGLLTNASVALGWMRLTAVRETIVLIGVIVTALTVYWAGLGVNWVLAGIVASQWISYALTLQPFVGRRLLDSEVVLGRQVVHFGIAIAAFGVAAGCTHVLAGMALFLQVAGQAAVGVAVMGVVIFGARWIPAMQVLARRTGADSPGGIVRGALAALK